MGIEPTLSAWKAEVLPLNYTRCSFYSFHILVEGEGFEPSKAEPSDLQSDPFDRSGTPPEIVSQISRVFSESRPQMSMKTYIKLACYLNIIFGQKLALSCNSAKAAL